jgi:hypothetical protein
VFALALGHQGRLPRLLQRPTHEALLGLDRVELAPGALGFEAGPLHGQLEDGEASAVLGLGLSQGLGRGRQCGGSEHGEDLVEDALFEPASPQLWQWRSAP